MIILLSSALLGGLSVREVREVQSELSALREGYLEITRQSARLETHTTNWIRELRQALEETDPQSRRTVLRYIVAFHPEIVAHRLRRLKKLTDGQLAISKKDRSRGGAVRRKVYTAVKARLGSISKIHGSLLTLSKTAFEELNNPANTTESEDEVEESETSPHLAIIRSLAKTEHQFNLLSRQLDKALTDATDRAFERTAQEERSAVWRLIVFTSFALVVGLLFTALASRALRPIQHLVHYARAVSRGDYNRDLPIRGHNELTHLAEELKRMAKATKAREEELDLKANELERAYRYVEELKLYNESIVRSLRTGVVVTNKELQITSTNRAAETLWGISKSLEKRQGLSDIPLGKVLVQEVGPLSALLQNPELREISSLQIDDTLTDVTLAPLENEARETLGLVVALEDVTEAVRTKEALIQSERLAAIGRMSAHVTHEIRNPLASIGLNTEFLEGLLEELPTKKKAEAEELSQAIGREIDRLTQITDDYLKFARLPQAKLRREDPRILLDTIAAFVRRDLASAKVKLEVTTPEEDVWATFDADQIRQAILNLVRNAKESMPSGGRVALALRATTKMLFFDVIDQGGGMSAEEQKQVFDPFFSTKETGTGLGLSLCQQIAREHGGELRVQCSPEGSTFTLALPRNSGDEQGTPLAVA